MSFAQKIRVAVLRGGPSSEYDVSLKSGEAVLKNLPSRYEGIDVFISKDGVWHVHGVEKSPAEALKTADVAFVALHGQYGEDGKVQAILERLGVPFTGSNAFASAVAMNKHLAKKALGALKGKIKMAAHKIFSREEVAQKGPHIIFREIVLPSIVKPSSAGSSIGISIVKSFSDLEPALRQALEHSDAVIIEEFIEGREATCGILERFRGEDHYAFLPIEIVHPETSEFFDYKAKYGGADGGALEISPGNFDEETKRAIQTAAALVHRELGLRHYSRSDFIIHPKRGMYFLEANTLPGLTAESLVPKSTAAVGLSMPQFLDHVISLARGEA
ncbi:MAG: D-alanine--D-alanine ligase [Patescibacteria group bacterium]|nr:D-alanine--D-alanine ligase [Patescibacteria group bacterium]MDE2116313.1 D-alanine--D-alanine ligase [Patescibacteria group bacterium]